MIRIKEGFRGQRSIVIPKMILDMLERDPLGSALHITDIGYYPSARHHFRERNEALGQFIFIYCVEGRGWYRIGDTRYDVSNGQFFILPNDRPHAYGSDDDCPWTIYWIHFNGALAPHYAAGMHTPHIITPARNSRISDRIAIMYLGQVVELCDAEGIYEEPLHPYTQALLSAIPPTSPFEEKHTIALTGDIPSPIGDMKGCPLASRCPHCAERCRTEHPALVEARPGHKVACFLYE